MTGPLLDHSATALVTNGYGRNWWRAQVGNLKAAAVIRAYQRDFPPDAGRSEGMEGGA